MNKEQAAQIALNGCMHLASRVNERGKFSYQIDKYGNEHRKYNSLRHAGAIWAMRQYNKQPDNNELICVAYVESACKRAEQFFINNFILNSPNNAYVKSNKTGTILKLGGNALAILALYDGKEAKFVNGDGTNLIHELINGIENFWVNNKLYSEFDITTGKFLDFESEYYPGEAAFALASIGKYEKSFEIVHQLYITRDRKEQTIRDHWFLQAIELLRKDEKETEEKEGFALYETPDLEEYAKRIAERMMSSTSDYIDRCTPTACMCEGLISYYNISKDETVLKFIEELLDKVATYQVKDGELKGAFFDSGISRIDYCQHAISACLRYSQIETV